MSAATDAAGHQADPARRARLRWRARRGLLENDLVLTRFLDRHEDSLSDDDVGALTRLLDLPDGTLLDLILARETVTADDAASCATLDDPAVRRVVTLLREA